MQPDILALIAAVGWATNGILVRKGSNRSAVASVFMVWVSGNMRLLYPSRSSLPFYGCAALISTTAQVPSFAALTQGDVSVVVTLTSTSPLFTVVLSKIFLRGQEKVDLMVILGVVTLVAAILIILNR